MKAKLRLICLFLAAAILMPTSVPAWDLASNNIFGFGYQIGIESDSYGSSNKMHGIYVNLGGLYVSANISLSDGQNSSAYTDFDIVFYGSTSEQIDLSFGYDFRIADWLYVPFGIGIRIKSASEYSPDYFPVEEPQNEKLYGVNFGVGLTLFDWLNIRATTTPKFNTFYLGAGINFFDRPAPTPQYRPAPQPRPAPQTVQPRPAPAPQQNPVITSEELRRVELAYAETVRYIENCGRRLYIRNMPERNVFIRQHQGSPAAASVSAARDWRLPYYNIREISQEDIVSLARNETNAFRKVRLIHDWVSDIFSYDHDLLWWMDNVSGRNAEFTLGKIVERQRGVCFEYAILFWFLADAAGLETYLILDHSQPGIGHAYNMVVINNTGYIIDTTWDSGNRYQSGRIVQFDRMNSKNYFMPDVSQSYRLRGW